MFMKQMEKHIKKSFFFTWCNENVLANYCNIFIAWSDQRGVRFRKHGFDQKIGCLGRISYSERATYGQIWRSRNKSGTTEGNVRNSNLRTGTSSSHVFTNSVTTNITKKFTHFYFFTFQWGTIFFERDQNME